MATLTSLQGRGAFTIQHAGQVFHLRPGDADRIVNSMSNETCRAYHLAARQGDTATAQRLFMETAALFYSAPAAPAITVVRPQPRPRQRQIAYTI